jgi:hypothetical protein
MEFEVNRADLQVCDAWGRYSSWVDGWISFERCGPEQVEVAYRALLDARVDPRTG